MNSLSSCAGNRALRHSGRQHVRSISPVFQPKQLLTGASAQDAAGSERS